MRTVGTLSTLLSTKMTELLKNPRTGYAGKPLRNSVADAAHPDNADVKEVADGMTALLEATSLKLQELAGDCDEKKTGV